MDLKKGIEIAKAASAKGYAVAVKNGKIQLQTIKFNTNGVSAITAHTKWIDPETAIEIIIAMQ